MYTKSAIGKRGLFETSVAMAMLIHENTHLCDSLSSWWRLEFHNIRHSHAGVTIFTLLIASHTHYPKITKKRGVTSHFAELRKKQREITWSCIDFKDRFGRITTIFINFRGPHLVIKLNTMMKKCYSKSSAGLQTKRRK